MLPAWHKLHMFFWCPITNIKYAIPLHLQIQFWPKFLGRPSIINLNYITTFTQLLTVHTFGILFMCHPPPPPSNTMLCEHWQRFFANWGEWGILQYSIAVYIVDVKLVTSPASVPFLRIFPWGAKCNKWNPHTPQGASS